MLKRTADSGRSVYRNTEIGVPAESKSHEVEHDGRCLVTTAIARDWLDALDDGGHVPGFDKIMKTLVLRVFVVRYSLWKYFHVYVKKCS